MSVEWTLTEAAGHCRTSKRTLMRRIDQLIEAGAHRDDAGVWRVSPAALRAAGFQPGKPAAGDDLRAPASRAYDSAQGDHDQLAALRIEAADWRRRAEVAEARAAERERMILMQAASLRMLEARPAPARRSVGEWLAAIFAPPRRPLALESALPVITAGSAGAANAAPVPVPQ
jgi:hypothetical protein